MDATSGADAPPNPLAAMLSSMQGQQSAGAAPAAGVCVCVYAGPAERWSSTSCRCVRVCVPVCVCVQGQQSAGAAPAAGVCVRLCVYVCVCVCP